MISSTCRASAAAHELLRDGHANFRYTCLPYKIREDRFFICSHIEKLTVITAKNSHAILETGEPELSYC